MRRVYQADARVLEAVEEGYYAASGHVPGVAGKLVLDFKVGVGGQWWVKRGSSEFGA